jgi:hypothetical chaperone protein
LSRVPNHHFVEAAMVQDLPRQRSFRKHDYDDAPEPFRSRLMALQAEGAPTRLHRDIEGLKVRLSDAGAAAFALDWIEAGLGVEATREQLAEAAEARQATPVLRRNTAPTPVYEKDYALATG